MTAKEKRFFVSLLAVMVIAILAGSILISLKSRNENKDSGTTSASEEQQAVSRDSSEKKDGSGKEEQKTAASSEKQESRDPETQASVTETSPSVTEPSPESSPSSETAAPSSEAVQSEETSTIPAPTETQQASVSPVPPVPSGSSQGKAAPILSWISEAFLEPNEYSRPQIPLEQVNNIVIHWVANAGSTAVGNREYFENLKDKEKIKVSSHYIVGLEGEILNIIPTNEIAYCNYPRNHDTISIENCHPDDGGKFNEKTYGAVIRLSAYLCEQYGLTADALIRHHDVSGKDCPKYYVEHPEAWIQFKEDVRAYMQAHPDIINEMP